MSKQIQTYSDLIKLVFPLNGLFNVQRKRTNDGLCNEFTVFYTFQMNWLCSPVWSFKQLHPLILVIMTFENFNIFSCFMFPWNKRPWGVAWIYIWDRRLQWNNLLIYHLIPFLSQAKSYQFEIWRSTDVMKRLNWSVITFFADSQVGFNSRYWLHSHLNLRVYGAKIENLRWEFGEDINFITFQKSVTSLVQQLKKKCFQKNCVTRYWLPTSLFTFILKFLD